MPSIAKDREKRWLLSPMKISSTIYHAEGNIMASPTQTVVGKSIPNLLIAEDLLKILRDLILLIPTRIPYQFSSWNGRTTIVFIFLGK